MRIPKSELPLPLALSPIDGVSQLIRLWIILEFSGLLFTLVVIDVMVKGLGDAGPWLDVLPVILLAVSMAVLEEFTFRGTSRFFLRYLNVMNAGLVTGTIIWIVLHQFYTVNPSPLRLVSDVLSGIFLLKVWRGPYWWVAFPLHAGWNALYIVALQTLRTVF